MEANYQHGPSESQQARQAAVSREAEELHERIPTDPDTLGEIALKVGEAMPLSRGKELLRRLHSYRQCKAGSTAQSLAATLTLMTLSDLLEDAVEELAEELV